MIRTGDITVQRATSVELLMSHAWSKMYGHIVCGSSEQIRPWRVCTEVSYQYGVVYKSLTRHELTLCLPHS